MRISQTVIHPAHPCSLVACAAMTDLALPACAEISAGRGSCALRRIVLEGMIVDDERFDRIAIMLGTSGSRRRVLGACSAPPSAGCWSGLVRRRPARRTSVAAPGPRASKPGSAARGGVPATTPASRAAVPASVRSLPPARRASSGSAPVRASARSRTRPPTPPAPPARRAPAPARAGPVRSATPTRRRPG
jgi:hypothetical protein